MEELKSPFEAVRDWLISQSFIEILWVFTLVGVMAFAFWLVKQQFSQEKYNLDKLTRTSFALLGWFVLFYLFGYNDIQKNNTWTAWILFDVAAFFSFLPTIFSSKKDSKLVLLMGRLIKGIVLFSIVACIGKGSATHGYVFGIVFGSTLGMTTAILGITIFYYFGFNKIEQKKEEEEKEQESNSKEGIDWGDATGI